MTTGRINQVAKELSSRPAGTWTGTSDTMVGTRHGPAQGQERNEREHTEMMPSRPYRYICFGRRGQPHHGRERQNESVPCKPPRAGRHPPTVQDPARIARRQTHAAEFAEPETTALGTEVTPSPTSGPSGSQSQRAEGDAFETRCRPSRYGCRLDRTVRASKRVTSLGRAVSGPTHVWTAVLESARSDLAAGQSLVCLFPYRKNRANGSQLPCHLPSLVVGLTTPHRSVT